MKRTFSCLVISAAVVLCMIPILNASASYDIKLTKDKTFSSEKGIDHYVANTGSSDYSPGLSNLLMALSWSAYNKGNIKASYEALGFKNIKSQNYYSDAFSEQYGEHNCAFTFGTLNAGSERPIIMITVRGSYGPMTSKPMSPDWESNFCYNLTENGNHYGFETACLKVKSAVYEYMNNSESEITDPIFVITGHSRGAAIANLLCKELADSGIKSENIYGYTFACPDVTVNRTITRNYKNIFNICNTNDIVALMPSKAANETVQIIFGISGDDERLRVLEHTWYKYGKTLWFTANSDEPYMFNGINITSITGIDFNAHSQSVYFDRVCLGTPENDYLGPECNIQIEVNHKAVISDVKPFIVNSRTLLPVRAIAEALGAKVSWDQQTQTAKVKLGVNELKIIVGQNVMYKNDLPITLDAAAEITDGRIMIPARAVAEALDFDVEWDAETATVIIQNFSS